MDLLSGQVSQKGGGQGQAVLHQRVVEALAEGADEKGDRRTDGQPARRSEEEAPGGVTR